MFTLCQVPCKAHCVKFIESCHKIHVVGVTVRLILQMEKLRPREVWELVWVLRALLCTISFSAVEAQLQSTEFPS